MLSRVIRVLHLKSIQNGISGKHRLGSNQLFQKKQRGTIVTFQETGPTQTKCFMQFPSPVGPKFGIEGIFFCLSCMRDSFRSRPLDMVNFLPSECVCVYTWPLPPAFSCLLPFQNIARRAPWKLPVHTLYPMEHVPCCCLGAADLALPYIKTSSKPTSCHSFFENHEKLQFAESDKQLLNAPNQAQEPKEPDQSCQAQHLSCHANTNSVNGTHGPAQWQYPEQNCQSPLPLTGARFYSLSVVPCYCRAQSSFETDRWKLPLEARMCSPKNLQNDWWPWVVAHSWSSSGGGILS